MGPQDSRREEAGEYDPTSCSTGRKPGSTQAEGKLGGFCIWLWFSVLFFWLAWSRITVKSVLTEWSTFSCSSTSNVSRGLAQYGSGTFFNGCLAHQAHCPRLWNPQIFPHLTEI